jgi:hypothetical protein
MTPWPGSPVAALQRVKAFRHDRIRLRNWIFGKHEEPDIGLRNSLTR